MSAKQCLYCYGQLAEAEIDFHPRCSKRFFGQPAPPVLDIERDGLQALAQELVNRSIAVTGVQRKLSLDIEPTAGDPRNTRLTIVGLWGSFILKPPAEQYPYLPENEDLTMHLAQLLKIPTAQHSLIRFKSGELAYLTKRFDRTPQGKLPMEDMCQLTEKLTEDKYNGSMEQVGKKIRQYSSQPGLDALTFFELALFSYLVGNSDMHLKNFSLLTNHSGDVALSPAYDLLSVVLAIPEDLDEMALTLNGRKRKIARRDFDQLAANLRINPAALKATYARFKSQLPQLSAFIGQSFLPQAEKSAYSALLQSRSTIL